MLAVSSWLISRNLQGTACVPSLSGLAVPSVADPSSHRSEHHEPEALLHVLCSIKGLLGSHKHGGTARRSAPALQAAQLCLHLLTNAGLLLTHP